MADARMSTIDWIIVAVFFGILSASALIYLYLRWLDR